jgi:shikimate kinase
MNIVLIGYRCCGKTTVGERLATLLGRDLVDTDRQIEEEAGRSVEAIVSESGWETFRALERELIERAARGKNLVIATGGGAIMDEKNVKNLKSDGWILWLKGEAEVIAARMKGAMKSGFRRPPLTGGDSVGEIERVLERRMPLYRMAAAHEIDTSELTRREVVASILEALPEEIKRSEHGR